MRHAPQRFQTAFQIAVVLVSLFCFSRALHASSFSNPLFGYTHMLQSPLTLPAGKFIIGTGTAIGVTDFFQVGTNLLDNFYQVYNLDAKLGFFDFDVFAFALTGAVQYYNLNTYSSSNPNQWTIGYMPGLVTAMAFHPQFALFMGGNFIIQQPPMDTSNITTSGLVHGAVGEVDLSWAYYPPAQGKAKGGRETAAARNDDSGSNSAGWTPLRPVGNVLSAGVTYDFTFRLFGVGLSHHWKGLHIGVHYYPGATNFPVVPILAGGASFDI